MSQTDVKKQVHTNRTPLTNAVPNRTLLIAKYFPPVVGGSTRLYEEIYGRYPQGSVHILSQESPGWEAYDARSRLDIHRVGSWSHASLHPRDLKVYLTILREARQLIRKQEIMVLHCDQVFPSGLAGLVLAKRFSLPCLLYAHGEEIQLYRRLFPEKLVMPSIYRYVTGVITNSLYTKELIAGLGVPEDRIHLIHPGVDAELFRPGLPVSEWQDRLNLNGQPILLTVGRLDERKGHDQVIRALPFVLEQMPELIYVIAGTGQMKDTLKRLRDFLGLQEKVRFLGHVADSLLPSLYNLADAFVMPNRETDSGDIEGFGIVFLEANACAKPVIAGRSGGASSAVIEGQTGVLVDGKNVHEIVQAVLRLLRDRNLANTLGQNGRERVLKEFDWRLSQERIQNLV